MKRLLCKKYFYIDETDLLGGRIAILYENTFYNINVLLRHIEDEPCKFIYLTEKEFNEHFFTEIETRDILIDRILHEP